MGDARLSTSWSADQFHAAAKNSIMVYQPDYLLAIPEGIVFSMRAGFTTYGPSAHVALTIQGPDDFRGAVHDSEQRNVQP